jgi:hypothetical protein
MSSSADVQIYSDLMAVGGASAAATGGVAGLEIVGPCSADGLMVPFSSLEDGEGHLLSAPGFQITGKGRTKMPSPSVRCVRRMHHEHGRRRVRRTIRNCDP